MPSKTYISGFDPKKLAAASGSPANDPWRNFEAWRYQGVFTRYNRFKGLFPGFGTAVVLFSFYLGFEALFMKDDHKHASDTHGEKH